MAKILIIDDDKASGRTLQLHLDAQGHKVATACSVDEGLQSVKADEPDVLISDIRMPGRSGLDGLSEFKQLYPHMRVIMITAFHDMESTIDAMQKGADEYIHKPIDLDELDAAIEKLLNLNGKGTDSVLAFDSTKVTTPLTMVGHSRAMKEIFKTIGLVAKNPATVLITGESGTGKELVARAIHRNSLTPDGPFVVVNCAALVETLLESDMFGHEKGAFTGAVSRQVGKFALANGGTIFLDEISEMSPTMQAKLLRVLQYKEFTPLGAEKSQTTDARIITATNVDLEDRVANGQFREDLYYRLQVVNIHLPPLRERKEDLIDLVETLLARINPEMHRSVSHISKDVLECFNNYDWPGNVRELENVLMKSVALSSGDMLTRDMLPNDIMCGASTSSQIQPVSESDQTSGRSLAEVEKAYVIRVLNEVNWHKGHACEILGISRPRLRRMIRDFQIDDPSGNTLDDTDDD
jgi:DNA-binding NtrC family response regulator